MVGYKPQDGDDVAIIEDVVTAGTAVRESIELFKHVAKVNMKALFVSVDRMERGTRAVSYTHLDVYKRQDPHRAGQGPEGAASVSGDGEAGRGVLFL